MVYKIVIDMMEKYYSEFEGPLFSKLRNQLIPFAKKFYGRLGEEDIELIKGHIEYFKPYYSSKKMLVIDVEFLKCDSKE